VDYNADKYLVEDSDLLTEAEKIQMAKDLVALERQGILEYRDGRWVLGAGVEETAGGPVAGSAIKKKEKTNGDRR
jgi:hypothetical protein